MSILLKGKNIIVREFVREDVKDLFDLAKDRDIARFTTIPHPYSRELAMEFILHSIREIEEKNSFQLVIESKETGKIIGACGLLRFNKESKKAELGYWIGKKYQRKRYGIEAAKLMIDYGFYTLELNRIEARVLHQNTPSSNLLEKAGFKYEGRQREAVLRFSEWSDYILYGLLKKDYIKKKEYF